MILFRFRNECPDGKLTKQHLKTLFEKVFPDGEIANHKNSICQIMKSCQMWSSWLCPRKCVKDNDANFPYIWFRREWLPRLQGVSDGNRCCKSNNRWLPQLSFQRIFKSNCEMSNFLQFFYNNISARSVKFCNSNRWREAEVVFPSVRHGQQWGDFCKYFVCHITRNN